MLLFVTLVYSFLQAKPHYFVPFRGLEIVLAACVVSRLRAAVALARKLWAQLP
jgi:hypothetical protein